MVSLYVSLDGLNYNEIDLNSSESIPMRYTFKDTQDISKVFSPYSLGFTFMATDKNMRNIGHYGNTDVIKLADLRKIKCKVYVNGILNQFGLLKLESITYKMGVPSVISASFATNMTDLKSRIGDDTINQLGDAPINWMPNDVYKSLTAINVIDMQGVGLKYFTPLASTNRVWQYDDITPTAIDNIAFIEGNPDSIKSSELRPAVDLVGILNLIKRKYNLQIVSPLEVREEVKDVYMWCMGENIGNQNKVSAFFLNTNLGNRIVIGDAPTPSKYTITSNAFENSFKILKQSDAPGWKNFVTTTITFQNLIFLGEGERNVKIEVRRLGDDFAILSNTLELVEGASTVSFGVPDSLLIADEIEFTLNLSFGSPTYWTNSKIEFAYIYQNFLVHGIHAYESNVNNNSLQMGSAKIDLIKSLPDMKVIDFLKSYFKAFNISALDVSANDDYLYWYTPEDIEATRKTVTYVADPTEVKKKTQDDFNFYSFKHADSNFRSNVDYKTGSGKDYGTTSFPEIKPDDAKEFLIETDFTIIPPVTVKGTENVVTMYGFEAGSPDITESGNSIYEPNFGELVLFYSHGSTLLNRNFAVQNNQVGGNIITSSIKNYIKVLPYSLGGKSLSWSVLVFNDFTLRDTLFSRYYAYIVSRLTDQNVMEQEFSLYLNSKEVLDFRLENDIIIGEDKFNIIDATIDITTGKIKLNLLNY